MRKKISILFMLGLMVSSGMVCAEFSSTVCDAALFSSCKSDQSVKLSLLHLNTMLKKADLSCSGLARVCHYITNNPMEKLSQLDVQTMVRELVEQLRTVEKRSDFSKEEQQVCAFIRKFLGDCTDLVVKKYAIAKAGVGPCFSELVVTSLEACDALIVGDLIVEGQIINECCDGTSTGGVGPTGPTGATGPTGPTGADATGENYLFATYLAPGLLGSDGNFQPLIGTDSLQLNVGEETDIPLTLELSMTNGWVSSGGSENGFIVPETALYQISYETHAVGLGNQYLINMVSWVEIITGSTSQKVFRSQVSEISTYVSISIQVSIALNHTFFALLTAGDLIQLRVLNGDVGIINNPIVIAATLDSSVASSMVITKIL